MQRRDLTPELSLPELPVSGEPAGGAARRPMAEPEVLSVAELDRRLKRVIEGSTADARVEGEIASLRVVGSGHAYFTLKDEREEAALDCVMYRSAPPRARRLLAEGARVVLSGRATVYVPRGRLQFCAEDARVAGRGALLEALERLKEQLAAEGLFAPERKRPLPADPAVVGVVTSADGAAIHDIVTVAFRRGGVRLLLSPTPVQGPAAGQRIAKAIALLEQVPGLDAIIVGRGGGSSDDLSAFNEEVVVRRVASARVPVVSAVGHEIDVSLTDLAADARAATPSQAAEMLVPDAAARRGALEHLEARMRRALTHRLRGARADLDRQRAALGTPSRLLAEPQQRVDDALMRLRRRMERVLVDDSAALQRLDRRLAARHPSAILAASRGALGPLDVRLAAAARRRLASLREGFAGDVARLSALSPLRVLARGYSIATDASGRAVRDHREVSPGDRIGVRLHRGLLVASVVASVAPGESWRGGGDDNGSGSGNGGGSGSGNDGGSGNGSGKGSGPRGSADDAPAGKGRGGRRRRGPAGASSAGALPGQPALGATASGEQLGLVFGLGDAALGEGGGQPGVPGRGPHRPEEAPAVVPADRGGTDHVGG